MRVLVLPEPGGARTWRIGDGEDTALRCAEFKPARIDSGALVSVVSGMVVVVIELCLGLLCGSRSCDSPALYMPRRIKAVINYVVY